MNETYIRQLYGIPDNATMLEKRRGDSLANVAFRSPSGVRRICKVSGNYLFFNDDDGSIKFIDDTWKRKGAILRPTATRHRISVVGGLVSYQLGARAFTMDFGAPFEIDGQFARADIGNGLTARLWTKAGKFEKWISGVGHPNLPMTQNKKEYVWSVPMSGLTPSGASNRERNEGTFNIRAGHIWNGTKRVPIKQRITATHFEKLLPVDFFEDGVEWTTDATAYYAGAGDGYCESVSNTSWATARGDTTGAVADYTSTSLFCGAKGPANFYVDRAFLPIDTSGITDGATISSALLKLYILTNANNDNDGQDYFTVVQTSQASTSQLVTADIDNLTFTSGSDNIDQGTLTTSAYNTWTLDVTGRGWISDIGFTKLGLVEGHDFENAEPVGNNSITFSTSEQTGTSQDPYLDITEAATFVPRIIII